MVGARTPRPGTPAPILRERGLDVADYLAIWLFFLYAFSARQVFGPMGAIGQPALLVALPALLLWVYGWLVLDSGLARERQPVRLALFLYLCYCVVSFAIAMARPLTELENSGSHRALVIAIATTGVALLASDGLTTRRRVEDLLRVLVLLGTLLSVVGILQFFTGHPFQVSLPGFQWQGDAVYGVGGRSLFNRPGSNTLHPIEFSVVTAALFPLAVHFALHEPTTVRRRNYATCAVLIGVAIPMAVSRSGIVSIVAAMGVMFLGWTWRRRLIATGVAAVSLPILWMTIPGLVGTIRSLFRGTGHDPSVQARIERVPAIMEHIREYPWFGRGNGTWSVEDYFLIDNELYVTTIEMGIVGMGLTIALVLLAVGVALAIRALPAADDGAGHLGRAIAACIAALGISILTFDAFHYRILTGTLFLLIGVAGAMWRIFKVPTSATDPHLATPERDDALPVDEQPQ